MIQVIDYFKLLVQQEDAIPQFEAAAAIAQHAHPSVDLVAVQNEVDALATRVRRRIPSDAAPIRRLQMLNHFFYQEIGFGGNFNYYHDADNSYLHRVLATRRGIPISLAVLYIEIGQQIGLDLKGISFPGHFLMKLSVPPGDIILDPINGASLSLEELEERLTPLFERASDRSKVPVATYLQAAHPREILARMLRNLRFIFEENQQWQKMLEVQQRLVLLLPGDAIEVRNRGQAYLHLNCPQAALADFEHYVSRRPDAADADAIRRQLPALRDAARKPD
jgi:regulator of sirC expression with transglutaminase-like and TPR domain